jgi:hypothetical protein
LDDDDNADQKRNGEDDGDEKEKKKRKLWEKLRSKTQQIIEKTSYGKSKYWTPAIGKYVSADNYHIQVFLPIMNNIFYRSKLLFITFFIQIL